jgi:hypothetical protein
MKKYVGAVPAAKHSLTKLLERRDDVERERGDWGGGGEG